MMNILGIDTSTKTMSIGLVSDDKILGEINFYSNMDHSEKLIDNIKFLLESNNLKVSDLDLVCVAIGPGSFTGVRIGISTCKGLVEFYNIPVVGVSSLEVLSRNFSSYKHVAIGVDAKRDRVYGGIYSYNKGKVNTIEEGLYDISDFKEKLKIYEDLLFAGDINSEFMDLDLRFGQEGNLLNRGSNVCFIGRERFLDGQGISHIDLQANYMTKSQAQIDYEKRNK